MQVLKTKVRKIFGYFESIKPGYEKIALLSVITGFTENSFADT